VVETGKGYPKKRWKITNEETCAQEGELVPMKGKLVDFWLKPVRGTPQKRLENHEPMKAEIVEFRQKPVAGTSRKMLETTNGGTCGYLTQKAGESCMGNLRP